MSFTVSDTRRVAPRPSSPSSSPAAATPSASCPTYAGQRPSCRLNLPERRLQHDAGSTGVPGWRTSQHGTARSKGIGKDGSRPSVNCRVAEVAWSRYPDLSLNDIHRLALTCQTGVMPYSSAAAPAMDRTVSILMLFNEAFGLQHRTFVRNQRKQRLSANNDGFDDDSLIPFDVMRFEFLLPWRSLRDEITNMLRTHHTARAALSQHKPGSREHVEASMLAQRTSPESVLRGFCALTVHDLTKWGADANAASYSCDDDLVMADDGTPSEPYDDNDAHAGGDLVCRGGACVLAGSGANPLENGSFVPTPGFSSRAPSPVDCVSPSNGADDDGPSPSNVVSAPLFDVAPKPAVVAAAVLIEPPLRPDSLAEALDAECAARRFEGMEQYRREVLAAVLRSA